MVPYGVTPTTDGKRMLDEDDLAPVDEAILNMLQGGRITAPFVADETGYNVQYVRDQLTRMVEHRNVRKVYDGLYDIVEDPREEALETGDQLDASVHYADEIDVFHDAEDVKRIYFGGGGTSVEVGITDEVMVEFIEAANEVFRSIHVDIGDMREFFLDERERDLKDRFDVDGLDELEEDEEGENGDS